MVEHQTSPAKGVEGENVLYARDVLRVIWSRKWIILLCVVAAVGVSLVLSLLQTPRYEASLTVLIGQESGIVENPTNVQGLRDLTQTMAAVAATRPVAEETIRRLDLNVTPEDFLEDRLSVNQVTGSLLVEVSYRDTDPERARQVVNTVGEVFSEQVAGFSTSASAVTATVVERAAIPDEPASPNPLRNAAAAFLVGGIIGLGLAFLLEYLDDRWHSPEEAERVTGIPTFGVIPKFSAPRAAKGSRRGSA